MASTIPAGGKDAISQARRRFWRGSSFRCRPVSLFITPAGQVGRGPVTAPREPQVPAVVPAQLSSPGARERSRRLHVTRPQGPAPPGQRHRLRSGLPGVLGPSLRLCSPFLASASAPQSSSLSLSRSAGESPTDSRVIGEAVSLNRFCFAMPFVDVKNIS